MKRKYSLDEFGVTKHDLVLDNGLQVIFIEKPFAPIYAKLMMRAGSIFNNGDTGLAHFTEHVIVSGSEKYPKKEDFAGIISSIGGHSNAKTDKTELCVECEVAIKEHLPNMREYFTEALCALYITPDSLKKEKSVIISEIQQSMSKPWYMAGRHASGKWANGTIWDCSNLGTVASVTSIQQKDVEDFFKTYCCVENMLLVIAGGCTVKDVKETFSTIPFLKGVKSALPESPAYVPNNQRIFFEQDLEQTNIGVIFSMPNVGTKEGVLLTFAMKYAHDGLSSRFYKKIRNERGLAYNIECPIWEMNLTRYGGTATGVPPDRVNETINSILECYEELLIEGITQKQIEEKITTQWFSEKRNLERSYDWVERFDDAYPEIGYAAIEDFPGWYNHMQHVTAEEINHVLRSHISTSNFHLTLNGREESKKYF
jgi:zinc protease